MTAMQHDELFLAIGRLEGKLDSLLAMQGHQQEQLKEHDHRIRSLEHSKSFTMGWSAAIGAAVSIAANYIAKFMH